MSRNLPNLLKRSYSAARNTTLIKILQSEIKHEQTLNPFQSQQQHHKYGKLGDFILDYDNSRTQDIVLRRKFNDGGEEIALSALLGPIEDDSVTRNVLMKVCVSKPKLRSLLQFDCVVYGKKGESGDGGSDFEVENAYYLPSLTCLGPEIYKGPSFSSLDPQLQDKFKNYLIARGVGEDLTNFLLLHLRKKENGQYVNWLCKVETLLTEDGPSVQQK